MGHVEHFNAAGELVPSVSQVPGIFGHNMDGFEDWICKSIHDKSALCCTRAKRDFYKESANLGNDIHNLREAFLKGASFTDGVPEYQAKVFDPVARFYKESGYKPLLLPDGSSGVELQMTGTQFGGTLDGAGTFSVPFWESQRVTFWDKKTREYLALDVRGPTIGDVWIDDLKIKSKLDVLHPLQLYGYSLLLKEVHGLEAKWGLIIRREKNLTKSPEIQLRGYYLPAYRQEWEASLLMWRFLNV